ncbi:MAG: hypothetical protein ACON4C_12060 [Henriciella sp.]
MQFLFTVVCAALAAAFCATMLAPDPVVSVERRSAEVATVPGA